MICIYRYKSRNQNYHAECDLRENPPGDGCRSLRGLPRHDARLSCGLGSALPDRPQLSDGLRDADPGSLPGDLRRILPEPGAEDRTACLAMALASVAPRAVLFPIGRSTLTASRTLIPALVSDSDTGFIWEDILKKAFFYPMTIRSKQATGGKKTLTVLCCLL